MNAFMHLLRAMRYALAVVLLLAAVPGWAALNIDISKGGLQPLPIAVPPMADLTPAGQINQPGELSVKIQQVVVNDLKRSGLFAPIDRTAYLQDSAALWKDGPNFRDWRVINADAVVRSSLTQNAGRLTVDLYLYDVFQGKPVGEGKRLTSPRVEEWRYLAHRMADEIYTRLTGEQGYFTSRIAFIAQRGQSKWLSVMDQDGANRTDLTRGSHLVLTPSFSPKGESLFFLSYETGEPRIFSWELYTGKKFQIANYPGLNSTPTWSPDGRRMALTLSKDGNPEIYVRDIQSGNITRITNNSAIDTSPSWSPDGRRLVFNSNRGGTPQLYVVDASGGEPRRITYDGRYNAAPSWSPRGDLIAYVQGGNGGFRIALIDPDGKKHRTLTDSWMDESPTWSPNGRVILFSRQKGDQTRLYTIDLTGHNELQVTMEGEQDASDPTWSPLLR